MLFVGRGESVMGAPFDPGPPGEREVRIPFGAHELDADLVVGPPGRGIVVFAHGSGSGRKSPRNREVARRLQTAELGTLLLDLLTASEARTDERTAQYRFDIPRLTERLLVATDWLGHQPETGTRPLGFFGASTGGAVAMRAAVERADRVDAIVLRGARSDLGDPVAERIRCPTLILVGEEDPEVRKLNQQTMRLLRCPKKLTVIPGASHLFEEEGALEAVAVETSAWFVRHLGGPR